MRVAVSNSARSWPPRIVSASNANTTTRPGDDVSLDTCCGVGAAPPLTRDPAAASALKNTADTTLRGRPSIVTVKSDA
jgi:hypothetical protein